MKLPYQSPLRKSRLLRLIPRNAGKVAFIGDAHVRCGSDFHAINPECNIAEFLRVEQFLADDAVITGGQAFDGIMIMHSDLDGDDQCLASVADYLLPDGVLALELVNPFHLAQLDNVENSAVLGKEMQLKKTGVKSSKFWSDIRRKIQESGFHIDQLVTTSVSDAVFHKWQDEQEVSSFKESDQFQGLLSFIRSPYFLYRLTKKVFPKIHIQAQVLKPIGGVNDVRVHEPLEALASLPGVSVSVMEEARLSAGKNELSKIFLWHRPVLTWEKSLTTIQQLRKAGYLIITEFDDHHAPWPDIEANQFLSFAGVHAVQTTTPALAQMFRQFNPEIGVFGNQLNELVPRKATLRPKQTQIFFGALNRQADWAPIMGPLNKALNATKEDFCFEVVFDKAFYDALDTPNKHFTPQCPYGLYKSKLLEADISLMPLLPNEFNRMKSDLKFVEAAGCGAVPVASDVVYEACDPEGEFSIICKTPSSFADAVILLIEDPFKRASMQLKAREYVRKSRLLCHQVSDRYAWYVDLLNRWDSLDHALDKRLQNLRS